MIFVPHFLRKSITEATNCQLLWALHVGLILALPGTEDPKASFQASASSEQRGNSKSVETIRYATNSRVSVPLNKKTSTQKGISNVQMRVLALVFLSKFLSSLWSGKCTQSYKLSSFVCAKGASLTTVERILATVVIERPFDFGRSNGGRYLISKPFPPLRDTGWTEFCAVLFHNKRSGNTALYIHDPCSSSP